MDDLERCLASLDGKASADVLAQAKAAAASVRQELDVHKQAAAARQKSGQDWQAIANERETEAVRLRAEINRMRQALSSSTQAHGSQSEEIAELQRQLQEALALNKAQQRQAVVTTSAVEGPNAELHRLRAELEGRTEQLRRAEADLAAQTTAAATRLNEIQEMFSSKITDIRRNHQVQLEQAVAAARSAAASEAQAAAQARTGPRAGAAALEQQNAARLQRAEADAAALRQQLEAAQATSSELQGKFKQAQSDAESARSQLTSCQFSEKALKARVKDLEGQLAKLQQQQQQQQQKAASPPAPPAPPPPPKEAPPSMDMGMLNMMEGQLGRLSEIIRSREAELVQMRGALQAGLDERRELLRQVEALQAALLQAQQQLQMQQQHQQYGGSAPGSANGSISGGGSTSGLGSPKGGSGAVPARGLPHVGPPNRPYRTGLQSKPRFFK